MEDRNLLTVAAIVAIGLVILVAVVAAVYIMITSLVGVPNPTATPTPAPQYTPTPHMVIPAGPVTSTPVVSAQPVATPVQPVIKTAELVDIGTDKDTYNRGDTAVTYIVIKNTGNVPINEATLNIKVERYVSVMGYVKVQSPSTTLTDLNITPGNTKKSEYTITIPGDYEGVSTAGKYRFTIDVLVWGNSISPNPDAPFQKEVTVQ